jgi:hypothetical protein
MIMSLKLSFRSVNGRAGGGKQKQGYPWPYRYSYQIHDGRNYAKIKIYGINDI